MTLSSQTSGMAFTSSATCFFPRRSRTVSLQEDNDVLISHAESFLRGEDRRLCCNGISTFLNAKDVDSIGNVVGAVFECRPISAEALVRFLMQLHAFPPLVSFVLDLSFPSSILSCNLGTELVIQMADLEHFGAQCLLLPKLQLEVLHCCQSRIHLNLMLLAHSKGLEVTRMPRSAKKKKQTSFSASRNLFAARSWLFRARRSA